MDRNGQHQTHEADAHATPRLSIALNDDTARKKYTTKSSDTLTPWLDEALPGPNSDDTLGEHLAYLAQHHQTANANLPASSTPPGEPTWPHIP
jgi:hypothetical protein